MLKFKKGDLVRITSGKDKGKEGEITRVFPTDHKVVVKGLNLYKKHVKPTQNREGGIIAMERALPTAKITLLENGKPIRVGFQVTKNSKIRQSKKTGKTL